jgi:excisionase family DNA binding protein
VGYWELHRFLEGGIERISLNHGLFRGKESPQMNTPIAMSPRDAATSIGVSRSTLYRLIDSGQLRTVKIGRRTLIPSSSLLALIDDSEVRGSVVA